MNRKTAFIITGPTAVGKTAAAIRLAQHFNTEIISADSRQCYKEMNIGVARPSDPELASVPHHFIASHSIHSPLNAGSFEQEAIGKANEIFARHDKLVVVGGTGLYIRAFCEGVDEIPAADPGTRNQLTRGYEMHGLAWLQEEIREKDPVFYSKGEIKNPQRVMRALEVVLSTGRSIYSFRKGEKKVRDFGITRFGLELPREELARNISNRVDKMMEQGLVQEVASLVPYRETGPLQTVGYQEIFDQLDGKISLEQAVELIKIHTWQYAKRQMTWFRKEAGTEWMSPGEFSQRHF